MINCCFAKNIVQPAYSSVISWVAWVNPDDYFMIQGHDSRVANVFLTIPGNGIPLSILHNGMETNKTERLFPNTVEMANREALEFFIAFCQLAWYH